jgi:hypothetical protein
MSVQLDGLVLPRSGRVDVDIHVSADIQVSASTAQRRVSRLVIGEIGNLLYGGEPTLIVGERLRWHVPIMLAYPDTGPLGSVGDLDVDVETGEVLATPEHLAEIKAYAQLIAQRAAARAD